MIPIYSTTVLHDKLSLYIATYLFYARPPSNSGLQVQEHQ